MAEEFYSSLCQSNAFKGTVLNWKGDYSMSSWKIGTIHWDAFLSSDGADVERTLDRIRLLFPVGLSLEVKQNHDNHETKH